MVFRNMGQAVEWLGGEEQKVTGPALNELSVTLPFAATG